MEQVKYDVFISYSRKDYVENDQIIPGNPISAIIDLFDKNSISYWIDKEGIYAGTEFVEVISDAIASSKMMVFVSSINSNNSIYTAGEIHEAIEGKKLVIPVRIDDCKYNKKFGLLLRPLDFIDYKAQPNTALPELLRTVNKERERIENEEVEARKWQAVLKAKNEIKEKAKEFYALTGQQDHILKELYAKNKLIGNTTKHCPVCGNIVPIQSPFCGKCSWQFPKLYSLDGNEIPIYDETQLALALTHWRDLNNIAKVNDDYKKLEDQLQDSETKREELEKNREELKKQFEDLEKQLKALKNNTLASAIDDEILEFSLNDKVSFKMIRVEGGSFQMGAQKTDPSGLNYDEEALDDENPVHKVTLSSFYIGEVVVTQVLWRTLMDTTVKQQRDKPNPEWQLRGEGDNYPMYYVSWNECQEFIKKLNSMTGKNFRLPTEAEWEFAARGGNQSKSRKYSGSNNIDDVAWYGGNSEAMSHEVKTTNLPNELGIYDMNGNVWEWCQDWKGVYSSLEQTNPTGSSSGLRRVLRGGSWSNGARRCRVSARGSDIPDGRLLNIGFRLALSE